MIRRRPRTAFVPSILKADVPQSPDTVKTTEGATDAPSGTNNVSVREQRNDLSANSTAQIAMRIPTTGKTAVNSSEATDESQLPGTPPSNKMCDKKAALDNIEKSEINACTKEPISSTPGTSQTQNPAPIVHAQNETVDQTQISAPKAASQPAENGDSNLPQTNIRRSRAKFAPKLNLGNKSLAKEASKPQPITSSVEKSDHEEIHSNKEAIGKEIESTELTTSPRLQVVPQSQVSNIGFTPENQPTAPSQSGFHNIVEKIVTSERHDIAKSSESSTPTSQNEEKRDLREPKDQTTPHRRGKFKLAPKIFAASPRANSTTISFPPQPAEKISRNTATTVTGNVEMSSDKPENGKADTSSSIQNNFIESPKEQQSMECSNISDKRNETIISKGSASLAAGSIEAKNLEGPIEVLPTNIFQRRPKSRFLPSGVSLNSLGRSRPTTASLNGLSSPGKPTSPVKSVEQIEATASQHSSLGGEVIEQSSGTSQSGAQESGTFPLIVETLGAHHTETRGELGNQSAKSEKQQQPSTSSSHFPATAEEYHQMQPDISTAITAEPPSAKKDRPVPISIDLEQLKIRRSSLTLGELISCSVTDFRKMDPSCKIEAPDLEELMKAQVQERHRRKVDTNVSGILTFDSIKKEFVEHAAKKEASYVTKFEPKSEDADSTEDGERNNNTVDGGLLGKQESLDEDDCGPSNVFAPRLKMGEDGKFVLDEESLVIEQTSELTLNSGVVTQASSVPIGTYHKTLQRFALRNHRGFSLRWTDEELKRFFMAMQMVGVDFLMIMTLIPDRSHKELRSKFNTIDKSDPSWADRLLGRPLRYDRQLLISRYKADLRNMSQQNYEKRRMKLQFEAMRRNDKTHFKEWFLERDFEQEAEERAENLRKESGMKTKGSKANKQKQKDTSELEVQYGDEMEGAGQSNDQTSLTNEKGKKGQKRKSKADSKDGAVCQFNSQESNSQVSSQPKSKKVRRSKKVKIESGSASKPGPGRPLITGESSSETIRLSIEAAIDRYNKIKDATSNLELDPAIVSSPFDDLQIRDFDANQISLKQELNTSAPTSPSHLDFISVNVQYPKVALNPCNDLEAALSPSSSISVPRVPGIHSALPSMCNSPAMPDHSEPVADSDEPVNEFNQEFEMPYQSFESAGNDSQRVNCLYSNSERIVREVSVRFTKPAVEIDCLSETAQSSHLLDSYVDSSQVLESSQFLEFSTETHSQKESNYLLRAEINNSSANRNSIEYGIQIDTSSENGESVDKRDVNYGPSPCSTQAKRDIPQESSTGIQKCIDLVASLSANTATGSIQKAPENRGTKKTVGKLKNGELSDETSNAIASSIDTMLQKIVANSSFLDDYSKVSLSQADLQILEQENISNQTDENDNLDKLVSKQSNIRTSRVTKENTKAEKLSLTKRPKSKCKISENSRVPENVHVTESQSVSSHDCLCPEIQTSKNSQSSRPTEVQVASNSEDSSKAPILYQMDSIIVSDSVFDKSGVVAKRALSMGSSKLPEELADMLEHDLSDGEISKLANDFNHSFEEENPEVEKGELSCKSVMDHQQKDSNEVLLKPTVIQKAVDSGVFITEASVNDLQANDTEGSEFCQEVTSHADMIAENNRTDYTKIKSNHDAIKQDLLRMAENECTFESVSVNDLENCEQKNEAESGHQFVGSSEISQDSMQPVGRLLTPVELDRNTTALVPNIPSVPLSNSQMPDRMQNLANASLQISPERDYSPCNDLENSSSYQYEKSMSSEIRLQSQPDVARALMDDSFVEAEYHDHHFQSHSISEVLESESQSTEVREMTPVASLCRESDLPASVHEESQEELLECPANHVEAGQMSIPLLTETQDFHYADPIIDNSHHMPYSLDRIPSPPPIPANGEIGLIVLPEKLPYAFYFDGVNMIPGLVSESPEDPMAVQGMESGDSGIESSIQEQVNDSTENQVMEIQEVDMERLQESRYENQPHERNTSLEKTMIANDNRQREEVNGLVDKALEARSENQLNDVKVPDQFRDSQTESAFEDAHFASTVGITSSQATSNCLIQSEIEEQNEKLVTVKRKQVSPPPPTSLLQLGFNSHFGSPKTPAAKKTNPDKTSKLTVLTQQHSSPLVSVINVNEDSDGSQEFNEFQWQSAKTSKESDSSKLGFTDRSERSKTPPKMSVCSARKSQSSPLTSMRKSSSILNDSGFVSQVALDSLRDDHLITEIMQETEVIDIDAIEETIGVSSSTAPCLSKRNSNCDVFMPRITKRNRTVDHFDDIEDNNEFDSIENNFTIRH